MPVAFRRVVAWSRLSDLVNQAYGLAPEEAHVVHRSAARAANITGDLVAITMNEIHGSSTGTHNRDLLSVRQSSGSR